MWGVDWSGIVRLSLGERWRVHIFFLLLQVRPLLYPQLLSQVLYTTVRVHGGSEAWPEGQSHLHTFPPLIHNLLLPCLHHLPNAAGQVGGEGAQTQLHLVELLLQLLHIPHHPALQLLHLQLLLLQTHPQLWQVSEEEPSPHPQTAEGGLRDEQALTIVVHLLRGGGDRSDLSAGAQSPHI